MFGSLILPMTALSLLLLPLTKEFGWSRTEFSGGFASLMLASAIAAPFAGRLVDKMGVRKVVIGGTAIFGLLVMLLSLQSGALWQFYGIFVLLGLVGSFGIGFPKLLGGLFTRHRGKALAIFGLESSVAGAIAPILVQAMISSLGWRGMFVGMGCVVLATIPVLWIWLHEDRGATNAESPADRMAAMAAQPGFELAEVLRNRDFWFTAVVAFLAVVPFIGLQPHLVPFLESRGFNNSQAVAMLSAMTIASAIGTFVGGWVLDYSKSARIAVPFSLLTAAAFGLCFIVSAATGGLALLFFIVCALGVSGGAKRPMATYFQLRFFGLKSFGAVMGIQIPFQAVGMGMAPVLVGLSYDKLGSYNLAFGVFAGLMMLTVILYLLLRPYRFGNDMSVQEIRDLTAGA
ncbi:MAG: MFS transporter [Sphingomonadaceae bacterium]|nr:MFS transporter [Sphingomonadaceae bacterium]